MSVLCQILTCQEILKSIFINLKKTIFTNKTVNFTLIGETDSLCLNWLPTKGTNMKMAELTFWVPSRNTSRLQFSAPGFQNRQGPLERPLLPCTTRTPQEHSPVTK